MFPSAALNSVTDPELSTLGAKGDEKVIDPSCPKVSILPSEVEGVPTDSEVMIWNPLTD